MRAWWVALVLLVSTPAAAETQLLEAQQQLNAESARAAAAGEYDKAALLLRSSLELGELNITWLNLGRVLFKGGHCADAREAYQKALTAPAAPSPPADIVARTAAEFLAELTTACRGTLQLVCPESYEIYVDGEPAQCGARIELEPGDHNLRARYDGWEVRRTVRVVGVELTRAEVDVRDGAIVPAPEDLAAPEPEPQYLGWVAVGGGAVLLGAAGAYRWSYQDDVDEIRVLSGTPGGSRARYDSLADSIQTGDAVSLGIGLVGLAAVGVGVTLLVLEPSDRSRVALTPAGVQLSYRY